MNAADLGLCAYKAIPGLCVAALIGGALAWRSCRRAQKTVLRCKANQEAQDGGNHHLDAHDEAAEANHEEHELPLIIDLTAHKEPREWPPARLDPRDRSFLRERTLISSQEHLRRWAKLDLDRSHG